MRKSYYITHNVPTHAVCYLEYGEPDGLNEEDIENIDEWHESVINDAKEGYHFSHFGWGDEIGLTYDTAFGLPCDCIECNIVYFNKE